MDNVIKKISEVESAASAIMDDANARKKAFAQEMEARTITFDKQMEAETEAKIQDLRSQIEVEMNEKLTKQKELAECIQSAMEQNYEKQHTAYVDKLFQALTEE